MLGPLANMEHGALVECSAGRGWEQPRRYRPQRYNCQGIWNVCSYAKGCPEKGSQDGACLGDQLDIHEAMRFEL